jgi:hypothetical protein
MSNPTYLSIDIDFWFDAETAENAITNILDNIPKKASTIAVMNHQQLLKAVNESKASTLVNIDTHSDFAGKAVTDLNCGTWVAYVNWRKEGKYIWYRSGVTDEEGRCDWNGDAWNSDSDWKSSRTAHRGQGYDFSKSLDLKNVVGVGICLSPDFNMDHMMNYEKGATTFEDVFKGLVKKYDIPYLKGRRNENFGFYRIPSGVKMSHNDRMEEREAA